MSISDDFLSILACPICKKPLELSKDRNFLISREAEKVYRIEDGIPVLLVDEAVDLEVMGQQWYWNFRIPGEDGKLGLTDVRNITDENPFGINLDDPNGLDDILI